MALIQHATVAALQTVLDGLFPVDDQDPAVEAACTPTFIGVIDIGTGNFNVIFNTSGQPFLYYDFGGGYKGSAFTYARRPLLCGQAINRIFVQSNWDGDHWRSVLADNVGQAPNPINNAGVNAITPQARTCAWIIPPLPVNGMVAALRDQLAAATTVHRRPTVTPGTHLGIPAGGTRVQIMLCTGDGGNVNDKGLAIRVTNPAGGTSYMLLPGDAHFNMFPHAAAGMSEGLVASHHGSEQPDGTVPTAAGAPGPRPSAFSFGWGNAYGFPRETAGTFYADGGYDQERRMDTAGAEAAADVSGPRGNIALVWPNPVLGPGSDPGEDATGTESKAAAIAVVAAAAAAIEAEGFAYDAVGKGRVSIGAAYQATIRHAGLTYWSLTSQAGPMPPASIAGAAPRLTAAIDEKDHATAIVAAQAAVIPLIARCVARAHEALAPRISRIAWENAGDLQRIGSSASTSRAAAIPEFTSPQTATVVEAAVHADVAGSAVLAPLIGGGLTVAELDTAVRTATCTAAAAAHGAPRGNVAQCPSGVARTTATAITGLPHMTNVLIAGLAAAAAIQPGIATNPEAPNAIPVLTVAELNTLIDKLSVAVAAAIAGVTAGVNGFGGLTPEEAASIAAPAAMAAIASAAGVPQPGCHRHPHQCGTNVCRLTMHYAP